jgi:sec-independent protein translocase protein TatA
MNVFGIGLPEMAVIAAIGLLVFGPKRLPELGRTLGRTLRGFQSASREFEQEFRNAIDTETTASSPPAATLAAPAAPAIAAAAPFEAVAPAGGGEPPVDPHGLAEATGSANPTALPSEAMAPEPVGDAVAEPPPAG